MIRKHVSCAPAASAHEISTRVTGNALRPIRFKQA
jgi:hypothetical protein